MFAGSRRPGILVTAVLYLRGNRGSPQGPARLLRKGKPPAGFPFNFHFFNLTISFRWNIARHIVWYLSGATPRT